MAKDNFAMANIVRVNLEEKGLNIPGTAYFDCCLDNLFEYYNRLPRLGKYWVLDDNGEVIGGIGFYPFSEFDNCVEMQKIYVKKEFQGRGYGKELLNYLIEYVRGKGYKKIYLETHTNLNVAIKMYYRFGFKEIDKPKSVVHSTMNKFMIKNL